MPAGIKGTRVTVLDEEVLFTTTRVLAVDRVICDCLPFVTALLSIPVGAAALGHRGAEDVHQDFSAFEGIQSKSTRLFSLLRRDGKAFSQQVC